MDFDGVIVESNDAKTEAFAELFSLYPAHSQEMMDYHLKNYPRSRMMKFEYYVSHLMKRHEDSGALDEMADRFSELVSTKVINCAEVVGAREFLAEFSGLMPIYLSSATPQAELERIIESRRLKPYFAGVFGDPPCKKAEAIRLVLEREAISPAQAVFIGDAITDYQIANAAGLDFIGRDSGLAFEGETVVLYKDMAEIADVIRSRVEVGLT